MSARLWNNVGNKETRALIIYMTQKEAFFAGWEAHKKLVNHDWGPPPFQNVEEAWKEFYIKKSEQSIPLCHPEDWYRGGKL